MTSDKDYCHLLITYKLRKLVENWKLMLSESCVKKGMCMCASSASRSGYLTVQTLLLAPSAGKIG